MAVALRTAGCPSAERKALTTPTGGALPVAAPVAAPLGVDWPATQLRHQGRADALRRRRKERDDFLGHEGQLGLPPGRAGGRPSIAVWCNLRLTPALRTNCLQPLAERQATTSKKTGLFSPVPGCALLTSERSEERRVGKEC